MSFSLNAQKSASSISHSFFIAGPKFTGIIGESGEVIWDSKKSGARDGYVLKNGNILILDEATSALDAKNESIIISRIKKNFGNKIIIIISHKKKLIHECDYIIKL
jgi:ABC-type transport system involved in Fe-S cluster assembly fused permease/ATPase subunit